MHDELIGKTVGLLGFDEVASRMAGLLATAGVGHLVLTTADPRPWGTRSYKSLITQHADLTVDTVHRNDWSPELVLAAARVCDLLVLGPATPSEAWTWAATACSETRTSFTTTRLTERHGLIGPLVLPVGRAGVRNPEVSAQAETCQSNFGPIVDIAAALQANEVLRCLAGVPCATAWRRLIFDCYEYQGWFEDCAFTVPQDGIAEQEQADEFSDIAKLYATDRDTHSFNSILLDELIPNLLPQVRGIAVADVGAGAGQVAVRLASRGARVDAYEPSDAMRGLLTRRIEQSQGRIRVIAAGVDALADRTGAYDAVLCLNVLDHIEDLRGAMAVLSSAMRVGGTLILSVPHPVKDRGGWLKTQREDGWSYDAFLIDNYFEQGPCWKTREDRYGNVRITSVRSFHRTITTYCEALRMSGLRILRVLEPEPEDGFHQTHPILYTKCHRVPYFLVLVAVRVE